MNLSCSNQSSLHAHARKTWSSMLTAEGTELSSPLQACEYMLPVLVCFGLTLSLCAPECVCAHCRSGMLCRPTVG